MTEQATSKAPQIRFKGYEGDWECKKLRDLTETGFTNGIFNDPSKVGRGYRLINVKDMFSGSSIDVNNLSLIDIDENEFKKNRVRYGDIFFTRSSLVKEGIACSNVNLSAYQNITFDGHLIRMQPCREITDPIFLSYAFKTGSSRRQFILGGKTTTMTTIGQSDIAVVEVALPTPIEQTQIGEYFRELDRLIGLHQRKHDKLLTLKKAMLQKMFPQPGDTTPGIRFKGFSTPWVEKTLAEISEIKTGPFGSALHAKDYVSDGVPIITTEHFKFWHLPESKRGLPQISANDYKRLKNYVLKHGDIVFSRVGSIDINAHVEESQNGWLFSGRVLRVRTPLSIDSEYLHHELSTDRVRKCVTERAVGQTMPSINTGILGATAVFLPEQKAEQQKIGAYFRTLDELISKHAIQLQKLHQIKSACLEKMFT